MSSQSRDIGRPSRKTISQNSNFSTISLGVPRKFLESQRCIPGLKDTMYRYLKRYRRTGTGIVKSKEEKDCFAAMDRAAPEPCRQGRICLDHITCHGLESEKRIQNDSSAVPFLPGTPAPLDLDSRISASDSSWHCARACTRREERAYRIAISNSCRPLQTRHFKSSHPRHM